MFSCYDQTIRDFWTLTAEESTLLPGMTDKGRLGFAIQLKFIDIHGRFPEHHNDAYFHSVGPDVPLLG